MLLNSGDRLGAYEIVAPLGAGGMGEVYRARDTRLGRTVAIKILPPDKTHDESRQRFLQEARAASALTHPNIAALYDIASDRGIDFIVMEFVAGTPLNELLARKAVRYADALNYAIQIADAVAAAHAIGIVHRDLKPGNMMVTEEGVIKVLDFGLAKLVGTAGGTPQETTMTMVGDAQETRQGAIVGTAAYMSPEQALGAKVDRRSDIFSYGVVLYELFTGQRAFPGSAAFAVVSMILKDEPRPVREVLPSLPSDLEKIVHRCLRKDITRRMQYIDDVKIELLELKEAPQTAAAPAAPAPAKLRVGKLWLAFAVLALLVAGWFYWARNNPREIPVAAAPLTTYPGSERFATFSPDGNQIAFSWDGEQQNNFDIYVKIVGTGAPLRITNDPAPDFFPAWSPDGRWIAFLRLLANNRAAILLISPLGGPERKLTEISLYSQVAYVLSVNPPRVAWSADSGSLIIVDRESPVQPPGLFSLALETGEKHRITSPPGSFTDAGAAVSPDGKSVVFTRSSSNIGNGDLYVARLTADLKLAGEPKRLTFDNEQNGHPAWTPDGRDVIFSSARGGGTLGLWRISAAGGSEPQRLSSIGEDAIFPAISRQGKRMVYTKYSLDSNIWSIEINRPGGAQNLPSVPLVASTRQDVMPEFSPDGRKVAFSSDRSGYFQIWVCNADGSNAIQLTSLKGTSFHPAWSPDGQRIAFSSNSGGRDNIYVMNADGGKPALVTTGSVGGNWPTFSHDGKWIYFGSDTNGRSEIWRAPSQGGDAVQLTKNGGQIPEEAPDGKYLYYMHGSGTGPLYRVATSGGEETKLLDEIAARGYALAEDGIYYIKPPKNANTPEYFEVNANNTLHVYNFATGTSTLLATLPKALQLGVTVSPDGRSLLYPQIDRLVEDIMLVEGFH